jgi:hypothetical protein
LADRRGTSGLAVHRDQAQVVVDGGGDPVGVAGGEQVQRRAAQDGQREGALGGFGWAAAPCGRLCGGLDRQPVADGLPGES